MPFATAIASGAMPCLLEREPVARASGPGLDLVDDQQRAVASRELARRLEVAVGKLDDARLALDRLDDEGRDILADRGFERLDRRGQVLDARQQRLERPRAARACR